MCAFICSVKHIAVRMVEDVCDLVVMICFIKCQTFMLNIFMMYVLFLLFFDCGHRVVIVEKVLGLVGLLIFDNYGGNILK